MTNSKCPADTTLILSQMQGYAAAGISVIPIMTDGSKRAAVKWGPFAKEPPSPAQIKGWAALGYGIGLVCGKVSGHLEVLDCDDPHYWPDFCAVLKDNCPELHKKTIEGCLVSTPKGGFHLPFRCIDKCEGNQKLASRPLGNGQQQVIFETRGQGGYFLAPGSPATCHRTNKTYEYIVGGPKTIPSLTLDERRLLLDLARHFDKMPHAPGPTRNRPSEKTEPRSGDPRPGDEYNERGDVQSLLIKHGWTFVRQQGETVYLKRPGQSSSIWSASLHSLLAGGHNRFYVFSTSTIFERRAYDAFRVFAILECGGDLKEAARRLAKERDRAPAASPKASKPRQLALVPSPSPPTEPPPPDEPPDLVEPPYPPPPEGLSLTDVGNSNRLAKLLKRSFCYVDKAFYQYDGKRWREDVELQHYAIAKSVGAGILAEAAKIRNDDKRVAVARWGAVSLSEPRIAAMVRLVRPDIVETYDRFDRDPWLFNCANGTLDLRTGELRPHNSEDFHSKLSPVPYEPDAKCPTFEAVVHRALRDDEETINSLQRCLGYSLTGDTHEQRLFMLHGTGANSKSTIIEAIEYVLGGYATAARPETFLAQRNEQIPCDLADLAGARFVSAIETDQGRRLNEGLVKAVTGGDLIKARFLHRNFFTYRPQFKLWFSTNHKPNVRGSDIGIWRRIYLIPFTVFIPKSERDKSLPDKLRAEAPGILAWAVRGCREWQKLGLGTSGAIDCAIEEYKTEQDTVQSWIQDNCILDAPDLTLRASNADLLKSYTEWARANHENQISGKELGYRLAALGLTPFKSHGKRGWAGIRLIDPDSLFNDRGTVGTVGDGVSRSFSHETRGKNQPGNHNSLSPAVPPGPDEVDL
jgi:putative DNA primase/helicase